MKRNRDKKEQVATTQQEEQFVGNSIFHVDSNAFVEARNVVNEQSGLVGYQMMLKWNFANMVDKEIINMTLAFSEMANISIEKILGRSFYVNINPYEVIVDLGFLRNTDWWFECSHAIFASNANTGEDEKSINSSDPFVNMIAANIFGELTNRLYASIGRYYMPTNIAPVVQYIIEENYDDMIGVIKSLFNTVLGYLDMWGEALDRIEATYQEIPDSEDCECNCECEDHCSKKCDGGYFKI